MASLEKDTSSPTPQRIRKLAVLLGVALITLCAIWGWRLLWLQELDDSGEGPTQVSSAQHMPGSSIEVLDAWPETTKPQPDVTDSAPGQVATIAPQPAARFLRVHFRQGDNPVEQVEVILQLFRAGKPVDLRIAVSDAEGELILRLPLNSDEILLRCNDDRYHFVEQRVALKQIEVAVDIQMIPLFGIELTVAFDDGLAFSGEGSFFHKEMLDVRPTRVHAATGEWKSGGDSFQVVNGKCALKGVMAADCELWFYTNRAGYDRYSEPVSRQDLRDGARLSITIKPSKYPMGCLVLDFGDRQWDRAVPWSYDIVSVDQPLLRRRSLVNSPPVNNKLTISPLLEGEYRLWVGTKRLCWGQTLPIKSRETTTVDVKLEPECTVSARIQDESGRPISGAVMVPDPGDVPSFPASARSGFAGVSDRSGLAMLDGLTSDVTGIIVAAEGYEPVSLPVVLNSATSCDAGTLRLVPALGKITIRVINARPGASYSAMHINPDGRGGRSRPRDVASTGEVVYEGMPLRSYLVAVTLSAGGRVVSRQITLTHDQPEVIVELDVGEIEPAQVK